MTTPRTLLALCLLLPLQASAASFLPRLRIVSPATGIPLNGAKLYFYQTGTSTPLDTYSNEALTSANANPVVTDAAGLIPRIFLKTDQEYRVRIETSSGTLVYQDDNVDALSLSGSSVVTRVKQIASSPLDYGAAGNGSTNDATDLQEAIDGATGVIDGLGKTYRSDSALTLRSGLTLRNITLDFSQAASPPNEMVKAIGTIGSTNALTANSAAGDLVIDVTTASGLAEGDWLLIYSSADWANSSVNRGELVQIDSIASLAITLKAPVQTTYNTANSASVKRLAPVENVTLDNVTIITNPSGSGTGTALYFEKVVGLDLRDVVVESAKGNAIDVRTGVGVTISGCQVDEDNGAGVGINVGESSRDVLIDGCTVKRFTTGVKIGAGHTLEGVTQFVTVRNTHVEDFTTGVLLEEGTNFVAVDGCVLNGNATASGVGIYIQGATANATGNIVRNPGAYGIRLEPDNDLEGPITGTTYTIDGNQVYLASTAALRIVPNLPVATTVHVSVSGNSVHGATGGTGGVVVDGGDEVSVSDNSIVGTDGVALDIDGNSAARLAVVGNVVNATGASATNAVDVTASGVALISGNVFRTTTANVAGVLSLGAGSNIVGNYFERSDDAAECATLSLTDGAVTGNTFSNGTFGVAAGSSTRVKGLSQNTYVGQVTGHWSGTGGVGEVCRQETVTRATMTDGGATIGTKAISVTIPAGARYLYTTATAITGFAGDTSATIQIGDGADADRYSTGTPSVFTTASQGVDLGAPSGTAWHTAATTVTVTITSNADFANVSAGSIDLQFCYLAPI